MGKNNMRQYVDKKYSIHIAYHDGQGGLTLGLTTFEQTCRWDQASAIFPTEERTNRFLQASETKNCMLLIRNLFHSPICKT
jgi:hypothetical protein